MLPQVNLVRAKNGDFLTFYERAGISGVLTAHGVWDELTIELAKALLDVTKIQPVVFDIGANMGTFAIPVAKHIESRNGVIHAFEPQRIVFYQLCGNTFLNRVDNILAHKVALSNARGVKEIEVLNYQQAWNIGSYSFVPGKDLQEKSTKREFCNFERLDEFPLDSTISLIKIDVEGMELDVLEGGKNKIIASGYPPILFESNDGDPKGELVIDLLSGLGYQIMGYSDSDRLAQHPCWGGEIALRVENEKLVIYRIR
jgi:FkbM family methyltransferase